jgi:hypothetical protein
VYSNYEQQLQGVRSLAEHCRREEKEIKINGRIFFPRQNSPIYEGFFATPVLPRRFLGFFEKL